MSKKTIIMCDRCGTELTPGNWYSDDEICNECVLLIELAVNCTREDLLKNQKPGTTLKKIISLYEEY